MLLVGVASSALAQVVAPQLTSISLTSPTALTSGGTVSYSFSITPGTTKSIAYIEVVIETPQGLLVEVLQNGETSGIASNSNTATWPSGTYTVAYILIADTSGFEAQYFSGGAVTYPFGSRPVACLFPGWRCTTPTRGAWR